MLWPSVRVTSRKTGVSKSSGGSKRLTRTKIDGNCSVHTFISNSASKISVLEFIMSFLASS
ncbi:hypothetical protein E2C01_045276 [Portunus trituberculatus]|uniref:Uncharacterized protein n=1 Tax=Portunus trituberculatus TaxID=210409 RepID=A0A5B7FVB4_PORTR|nr:hypothetical protein [Portunus trituberculatus]